MYPRMRQNPNHPRDRTLAMGSYVVGFVLMALNPIGGAFIAVPIAIWKLNWPITAAVVVTAMLAFVQVLVVEFGWSWLQTRPRFMGFVERKRSPRLTAMLTSPWAPLWIALLGPWIGPMTVMAIARFSAIPFGRVGPPLFVGLLYVCALTAAAAHYAPQLLPEDAQEILGELARHRTDEAHEQQGGDQPIDAVPPRDGRDPQSLQRDEHTRRRKRERHDAVVSGPAPRKPEASVRHGHARGCPQALTDRVGSQPTPDQQQPGYGRHPIEVRRERGLLVRVLVREPFAQVGDDRARLAQPLHVPVVVHDAQHRNRAAPRRLEELLAVFRVRQDVALLEQNAKPAHRVTHTAAVAASVIVVQRKGGHVSVLDGARAPVLPHLPPPAGASQPA
jgi:hypothetical protein